MTNFAEVRTRRERRREHVYELHEMGYRLVDLPGRCSWDEFRRPGDPDAVLVGNCYPNFGVLRIGPSNARSHVMDTAAWRRWLHSRRAERD